MTSVITLSRYQTRSVKRPRTLSEYIDANKRKLSLSAYANFLPVFREVYGPGIADGLESGAAVAQVGTNVPGGPAVKIAAAIGGLVTGFILGVWPSERWANENQWLQVCQRLTPLQRMILLASLRPQIQLALRRDKIVWPRNQIDPSNFRWADDVPKTIWGGPVSIMVGCIQGIYASGPVIPAKVENDTNYPILELWALTYSVGSFNDDQKYPSRAVVPSSTAYRRVEDGSAIHGDVAFQALWTDTPCGAIREKLVSKGVTSIFDPPITSSVEVLL